MPEFFSSLKLYDVDEHRMGYEIGCLSNTIDTLYAEWEKRHGVVIEYRNNHSKLLAWTKDGEVLGPPLALGDLEEDENVSISSNDRHDVIQESSGEYIVTIAYKSYRGAPTFTQEKAEAAFSAALADLPKLKKISGKIDNTIKQLEDFGGLRMRTEIDLLNLEFSRIVNDFEKRHGVVQVYSEDEIEFRLAAWTEKGMVTGPVFLL
jgi:hypothetical protein